MADKKVIEQYYTPPPKLGNWESFKLFLWNGETSQFMGRTAGSWAKILFFYVLFYAALAAFFGALLTVFWQTLDDNKPKWQLADGIIGANPGLGFRPMPPEANVGSTLIWYKSNRPDNMKYWHDTVDEYLKVYSDNKYEENKDETCGYNRPAGEGKYCPFKIDNLDNCSPKKTNHKYGFPENKPCIFLKLNKIYNWTPKVFNETSEDQITDPEEKAIYKKMPQFLKKAISGIPNAADRDLIWVSCEGENPADTENLGPVNYSPRRGFPSHYFPFKNVKGYHPPIVAVQFERPKRGVLINIECKAWAKNIRHDRAERRGSVHFELMID